MIEPSRELRDTCAVVGAGHSRLGKVPGVSSLDLLVEAIRNAIDDAGLEVTDIDGLICLPIAARAGNSTTLHSTADAPFVKLL